MKDREKITEAVRKSSEILFEAMQDCNLHSHVIGEVETNEGDRYKLIFVKEGFAIEAK